MLLKKELSAEQATAWTGDELERKKIADYLTPVIASIRQPFVISLNSEYGTGKTFFIKHWHKDLVDNKGYKAVYFNAWESDYAENAFISFISSIKKQLEEKNKKNTKDVAALVKKGAIYATRKIAPLVAKGIARKLIDSETVKEIADLSKETDKDVADLFGKLAEDSLRKHEEIASSIEDFREYLGAFVQEITKDADNDDKKKLIIFVDELDRCRPTYAIEVLECIKHLFNVPNVVFIIAVDDKQLKAAVASVYGTRIDGEGYLRKFIDWQLNLPKPSSLKYANYLYNSFNLDELGTLANNDNYTNGKLRLIKAFGVFSYSFGMTLREQSQCFTEINLVLRSLGGNAEIQTYLSGVIPVLKLKCSEQLKDCIDGRLDAEQFTSFVETKLELNLYKSVMREWEEERAIFHALFTDSEHRKSLSEEYNGLVTLQKTETLNAEKQKRLGYLDYVIRCIPNVSYRGFGMDAEAKTVYDRFAFAANLVKHN